jgi:hypothetical protein
MSHSQGNGPFEFTIPHTVAAVLRRMFIFFSSERRFALQEGKDGSMIAHRKGEFMLHTGYTMIFSFSDLGKSTGVRLVLKDVDKKLWPELRHLIDWWTDFMEIESLNLSGED